MYEYKSRIRYSEINSLGKLSLSALVNYFQDCSIFHSEDIDAGLEYYKKQNIFWALNSWQIIVHEYPKMGEIVTIGTAPYDFKGFIGYRNFWMKNEKGDILACANSIWSLIHTDTYKPVSLTEDIIKKYQISEKMDMDYADRHIKMKNNPSDMTELVIKPHNIDTNLHVNNSQYIQIGLDYLNLEEREHIRQLRAEYKLQAFLGDTLYPKRYEYDNCIGISLQNDSGKSYCNMEFALESR